MQSLFKKGDKVVMHSCHEINFYEKGKIWICETDSFVDKGGDEVVFLEGFSGSFMCKYLTYVNI